jgi:hypothetical protein
MDDISRSRPGKSLQTLQIRNVVVVREVAKADHEISRDAAAEVNCELAQGRGDINRF